MIVTSMGDPDPAAIGRPDWLEPWAGIIATDSDGRYGMRASGSVDREIGLTADEVRVTVVSIPDGPATMKVAASGGPLILPIVVRVQVLPIDVPAGVATDFVDTINANARCRDAGISARLVKAGSWTFRISSPADVAWTAGDGIELARDHPRDHPKAP
jgi:hypothetical protein